MKALHDKIREKGMVRTESILDVSQFMNGAVDAPLMVEIGKDFAEHFASLDFDLFVTVESSGIAPSVFASLYADKPLVVIKKQHKALDHEIYAQQASYSFTKQEDYFLTSKRELITGKKVVLIDDFLAQGSVVTNVDALLKGVGSELVGVGICISKNFQPGYAKLVEEGYNLYSQAQIKSMDPESNTIEFQ